MRKRSTERFDACGGTRRQEWTGKRRDYEQGLAGRLRDLHDRVHSGRYQAHPARRVYIPKSDGGQRPLGIPALEAFWKPTSGGRRRPIPRGQSKARFAAELRKRYCLRLHVVILAGAVLAGTLASALALDIGVHSMSWRYLLGLGIAYMTFLGLVRVWIAYVAGWRPDADPSDLLDCYDLCSNTGRAFDADGGTLRRWRRRRELG